MRKAASLCGGDASLSRVLRVPRVQVRRWMGGEEIAPLPVFNQALRFVNASYHQRFC
jgi:hypothetical protein